MKEFMSILASFICIGTLVVLPIILRIKYGRVNKK